MREVTVRGKKFHYEVNTTHAMLGIFSANYEPIAQIYDSSKEKNMFKNITVKQVEFLVVGYLAGFDLGKRHGEKAFKMELVNMFSDEISHLIRTEGGKVLY